MWNEPYATQLVGSWVKPHWLADHAKVYAKEGSWWRLQGDALKEGLDDAVRLAVYDQNYAGVTYATDGEQRRQTFSGHFYGLGGIDTERPGEFTNFHSDILPFLDMRRQPKGVGAGGDGDGQSRKVLFPRVIDKISWPGPMLLQDHQFLRRYAARRTKVTVIGPVTLAYRLVDDGVYGSERALALGVAEALNQELRALSAAGCDLVQVDEPEVHFRYSQCKDWAVEAINRMLHGVTARSAVHVCYGYSKNIAFKRQSTVYPKAVALIAQTDCDAISVEYEQPKHEPDFLHNLGDKDAILGVLDLNPTSTPETVDHIVARVRAAEGVLGAGRLSLAPDCGMWFLPRDFALRKLRAMCLAAEVLRAQVG